MKILARSILPLTVILGSFLFSTSEASAQAGGPQVHTLEDSGMKDFGQNLGRDWSATIRNIGNCPIMVVWFDKQANGGKWKHKVLNPGQAWHRIIEWGEYLEVHDMPDHHSSKFGSMIREIR